MEETPSEQQIPSPFIMRLVPPAASMGRVDSFDELADKQG